MSEENITEFPVEGIATVDNIVADGEYINFEKVDIPEEQLKNAIYAAYGNVSDEQYEQLRDMIISIASLLSLDDDKFEIVKPVLLDSFERSFNTPDNAIALAQMINAAGGDLEEVIEVYGKALLIVETGLNLTGVKAAFIGEVFSIMVNTIQSAEGVAKRIISVPIEIMEHGKMPTYAHDGDGALDLYAPYDIEINPGETVLIKTGIKIVVPKGYCALVQPRSGLSLKSKLRICNTPGLIDSNYRGEIGIIMENIEPRIKDITADYDDNGNMYVTSILYGTPYSIGAGERIAQLRFVQNPTASFNEVETIGEYESDRNDGGFGSSGK